MSREEGEAIERLKAALARELEERKIAATWVQEERKHYNAERLAMATTAAGFANGALRGLLLVNGGAAIALMTLIGNAGQRSTGTVAIHLAATAIKGALVMFAVGLASAVLALGLSYVSQTLIREGGRRVEYWIGGGVRLLACVCAVTSLAAFVRGILQAVEGVAVTPI